MATVEATPVTYTPEELLALPDAKDYELVDGHLVERNMSVFSSVVEAKVLFRLASWTEPN